MGAVVSGPGLMDGWDGMTDGWADGLIVQDIQIGFALLLQFDPFGSVRFEAGMTYLVTPPGYLVADCFVMSIINHTELLFILFFFFFFFFVQIRAPPRPPDYLVLPCSVLWVGGCAGLCDVYMDG